MQVNQEKTCECSLGECHGEDAATQLDSRALTMRYLAYGIPLLALWWLIYWNLAAFSQLLTYTILRLPADSHFSHALEFFVFDVPKVLMLLTLVVFGVGVIRSFFTPEHTRAILAGRRESAGNVLAALLGVVTPFCSCSAVPLFLGFVTTGVPLGLAVFPSGSPLPWSMKSPSCCCTVCSAGRSGDLCGTGLAIAIIAGWTIGRLKMERYLEDWVFQIQAGKARYGRRAKIGLRGFATDLKRSGISWARSGFMS